MRKFLSMVLALTMTMSLVTAFAAPASAKNFTDFEDSDQISDVHYEEAIDVITAVGIMNGRSDTTFAPKDTLTRGAASKIICNMLLGPSAANALPSSANPFKDVAAGSTYAGYIAYVSGQGIVNGYSDGTFRPAEALSGYAFLKMLLGALGYSTQTEGYTGDNWKVNVAKQATGNTSHITKNLIDEDNFNGNEAITREEAALFAFNTLCTDMVEYGLRVGNGLTIVNSDIARSRLWEGSSGEYNNIVPRNGWNGAVNGDAGIVQFAEENFPRLERSSYRYWANTDAFGRPQTTWTYKGVEIGTYTETYNERFVGNIAVNKIYSALNMATPDAAQFYINGIDFGTVNVAKGNDNDLNESGTNISDNVMRYNGQTYTMGAGTNDDNGNPRNSWANYAKDKIGDGTIIEVFLDPDYNDVTICAMSVYAGKVTAVKAPTSTKDDYVIIAYSDANQALYKRPDTITRTGNNEYETTDFEEEDVVWYTYSDENRSIEDMGKMEAVEGALTRRFVEKRVVIAGQDYNYGKMYTFSDMTENELTNKSDYIVYLDDNGYALWIEEAEINVDDYALIETIAWQGANGKFISYNLRNNANAADPTDLYPALNNPNDEGSFSENKAKLLFGDGRERTVTLDDEYSITKYADGKFMPGRVVRATRNDDGEYKLQDTVGNWGFTTNLTTKNNDMYVGNGAAWRTYVTTGTGTRIDADAKTVFVIKDRFDSNKIKTYTGVRNVPDMTGGMAFAYEKGGVADVVFVTWEGTLKTSKTDIMFIAGKSMSKRITSDSTGVVKSYRAYNAVVNGDFRTVYIAQDPMVTGATSANTPAYAPVPHIANGYDKQYYSFIVNDVDENSDDIITRLAWDDDDASTHYAYGIRKYIDGEIKVNTNTNAPTGSRSVVVSDNAFVYYVNGDGEIDEVDVTTISTDSDDIIYYIIEDGEIQYLWVCEYDSSKDGTPPHFAGDERGAGTGTTNNTTNNVVADSISVTTNKTTYFQGEAFDKSSLTVTATISGVTGTVTDLSAISVSGFDSSVVKDGLKVTVSYGQRSQDITVNIVAPTVAVFAKDTDTAFTAYSHEATATPTELALQQLVDVKATYTGGSQNLAYGIDYTIDYGTYNSTAAGDYTVTVKKADGGAVEFADITITVTVTAPAPVAPTVTGITVAPATVEITAAEIAANGTDTAAWDTWLAAKGVKVTPTMSDNSAVEAVQVTASMLSLADFQNLNDTTPKANVTVSYSGFTSTFEVSLVAAAA